jgi:hypothetical protein
VQGMFTRVACDGFNATPDVDSGSTGRCNAAVPMPVASDTVEPRSLFGFAKVMESNTSPAPNSDLESSFGPRSQPFRPKVQWTARLVGTPAIFGSSGPPPWVPAGAAPSYPPDMPALRQNMGRPAPRSSCLSNDVAAHLTPRSSTVMTLHAGRVAEPALTSQSDHRSGRSPAPRCNDRLTPRDEHEAQKIRRRIRQHEANVAARQEEEQQ